MRAHIAQLVHELRTHVTLLGTSSERLAVRPGGEAHEALESVRRETRHLSVLADTLDDLGRLDQGSLVIDLAPEDPGEVLDRVVALVRPGAADFGLTVVARAHGAMPLVFLDRRRVESALLALARYCIAHTPSPGTIRLELDATAGGVRFVVQDSGPQVPDDDLARLLVPAESPEDVRHAHRPLGLPLARAVAAAHGGGLSVTSRPGVGLRFELSLPTGEAHVHGFPCRRLAAVTEGRPRRTAPERAPEWRPTVVVVEDEAHVNDLIAKVLARHYDVYCAPNAQVALPIIREVRPDLVVTDHALPRMDGGELCRALGSDDGLRHTPVLMLSASLPPPRSRSAQPVVATMHKPFRPLDLLDRVDRMLRPARVRPAATPSEPEPRAAFDAAVAAALQRGSTVAVVFLGVSGLAQVESLHGRLERERMAKVVERRLRDNLRTDDACLRLEGDVFGVLLAGVGAPGARAVATRLLRTLAQARVSTFEGTSAVVQVRLRGHAGLAIGAEAAEATELVSRAERGLRIAEARGIGDLELVA